MSDIDTIRRIAERGLKAAQGRSIEFIDLFQHLVDECQRIPSSATSDVIAERRRQVEAEGWTTDHDDQHACGSMAAAAGCYALYADAYPNAGEPPPAWPWDAQWWKPRDYRRDLVRSAALLIAEIERIDRREVGK